MKFKQLVPSLLLTSVFVALLTTPAKSQEKLSIAVDKSTTSTDNRSSTQLATLGTKIPHVKSITEIKRLSEIKRPSQSAQTLLVQSPTPQNTPTTEIVQVTGVKANPTNKGLDLILQTSSGQQLQLLNRSAGKSFIVDIPSAQLRLPSGHGFIFRSKAPIAGVSEIIVTNFNANTIRVTVTAEAKLPTIELFDSPNEGLIFSVASTTPVAQQVQPSTQQPQVQQQQSQTQPSQPSSTGDEAIELVVRGEVDGYNRPDANTATRTDTPLRDIPQSIQVIPQEVLKDQQITRIEDAVRNVSGVTPTAGYGGSNGNYTIRGFYADNNLRNGFRDPSFVTFTDPANIERIEVLKGPASVLYGRIDPGGVVNYVTKKPLSDPYYAAQFDIGSYSFYRPAIDLSGPLTADKRLLYRLNVGYENAGSFRDYVNHETYIIAPVFTYKISDKTSLTLEAEYNKYNGTFDRGFTPDAVRLNLPRSRFLGEPGADYTREETRIGYILDHHFSNNWQIRNAFSAQIANDRAIGVTPSSVSEDGLINRTNQDVPDYARSYSLQTDLVGKFNTGSIQHQLLFGVELARDIFDYDFKLGSFPSIDPFNPVYGRTPISRVFDSDDSKDRAKTDTLGIYLQDQVTLLANLKLLVGGRYDIAQFNDKFTDLLANTQQLTNQQFDAFSPRFGLVYQPIQPISLYASYSRSFKPNTSSKTVNGALVEPERGTQYEVGVKAETLNGKLSGTLAYFDITKTNVATTDPSNPNFSITAGEVKSRGIELDIAGEILPGLNVIASYSHNDAFVSQDNSLPRGDRLIGAARNLASLWTTYKIQNGDLKGLGFGAGVFFVGDREAQLPNNVKLPSYLTTEATIFYQQKNWRFGLNFKNIFNTKYYKTQGYFVDAGAPFTVIGNISVNF
ncbi:MAG: TonB-dependent siderophore receptor [Rhizonema sp. PD37]|nr:TonB-dependent siderophore receptor [Rhizonema sp. PD37]